jgi:hypothetical protein
MDGIAGGSGLPSYRAGEIKTAIRFGNECVIEMQSGVRPYEQRCLFSGYRAVGPGLLLPAKVHLAEFYSPEHVLPYGEQYDADYTLVKASAEPLPTSQFEFETQLSNTTIVQDNTRKRPRAIRYVPGKTLAQQFADARLAQSREALLVTAPAGRSGARAFGLAALLAAVCGWFVYRRTRAA